MPPMKGLRGVVPFVLLAGCAKGGSPAVVGDDDVEPEPDAPAQMIDAKEIDAPAQPIDAPAQPIDAPPPPDAAIVPPDACVPQMFQKLANPALDLGVSGWTEVPL